jgi:hypothetical protein
MLARSLAAIPHWTLAYATALDLTPAAHWPEPHVVTAPARLSVGYYQPASDITAWPAR